MRKLIILALVLIPVFLFFQYKFFSTPLAQAIMEPTANSEATGTVEFFQVQNISLIKVSMKGVARGQHGLHIHEKGDCSAADGTSAGGHFNSTGSEHGSPEKASKHVGDLGNITADASGKVSEVIKIDDMNFFTNESWSIGGRALILHEKADDLITQPTGNSGARIACGVIQLTEKE